jgi:PPM family protein phosphatase
MILTLGKGDLGLHDRADRLLQLALNAGGDDNISVALLEQHEDAGSGIKEWNS